MVENNFAPKETLTGKIKKTQTKMTKNQMK